MLAAATGCDQVYRSSSKFPLEATWRNGDLSPPPLRLGGAIGDLGNLADVHGPGYGGAGEALRFWRQLGALSHGAEAQVVDLGIVERGRPLSPVFM